MIQFIIINGIRKHALRWVLEIYSFITWLKKESHPNWYVGYGGTTAKTFSGNDLEKHPDEGEHHDHCDITSIGKVWGEYIQGQ